MNTEEDLRRIKAAAETKDMTYEGTEDGKDADAATAAITQVIAEQQKRKVPFQRNFFDREDEGVDALDEAVDEDFLNEEDEVSEDEASQDDLGEGEVNKTKSGGEDSMKERADVAADSDDDENITWEDLCKNVQVEMGLSAGTENARGGKNEQDEQEHDSEPAPSLTALPSTLRDQVVQLNGNLEQSDHVQREVGRKRQSSHAVRRSKSRNKKHKV